MSAVLDRFLDYIQLDTTSREESETYPSSPNQLEFGRRLVQELQGLGLNQVRQDEHGYVTAIIPATREGGPVLGLLTHMDTSSAVSGEQIQARLVEYMGGSILLNEDKQIVMRSEDFPFLADCIGKTLVVTDGTTLLGADDKAGVAEVVTLAERLMAPDAPPHGEVRIAFTPDEEISGGTRYFDIPGFGADFAYTVDGGELGELNYENFNAAGAKVTVRGLSVHTGSAKDAMKNACAIACEFVSMLPPAEVPEHTQGREGFYHLCDMSGDVTEAKLSVIIRDHDKERFQARKRMMETITALLNARHGAGTVELALSDSYYNMLEPLGEHMDLVENARAAMRQAGVEPVEEPIRGGTDGARLTYDGLPCPNLSTGGFNFHGVYEAIPVASMEKMVEIILNLVTMEGRN